MAQNEVRSDKQGQNGRNVVIVTGLSGAGKSQALRTLEDLGYFCVDNLPPSLIPTFIDLYSKAREDAMRIAMVVDIRGGEFFSDLWEALRRLREKGIRPTVLFLEAEDDILVRRFKETRRRHPLSPQGSILEGLRDERSTLADVKAAANIIVDTSDLSPSEFRKQLMEVFSRGVKDQKMLITVVTFGFKHGLPLDADLVFDVRFLPNPFYIEELKPLSGTDPRVVDYLFNSSVTTGFFTHLKRFIDFLLPKYVDEGKTHLNIALGCTGGRHRSVALGEALKTHLESREHTVVVEHRDIDRGESGGIDK